MKKLTISIFATGVFVALASTAMAQPIAKAANANAVAADQLIAPDVTSDPALLPDAQATAQPKLKFKIKGVNVDDDQDGADGKEGGDGQGGDSQHESENDHG